MSIPSEKIRVAVLYGGRSNEHEVSLRSAANVIQNLDKDRFEVVPIGIDKQGAWYLGDASIRKRLEQGGSLELHQDKNQILFTPDHIGNHPNITASQAIRSFGKVFDVVFPVIHGHLCEDGTVQGLLELADVPYVGSGVLASAMGMDKDIAKRIVRHAGLLIPEYVTCKIGEWKKNPKRLYASIAEKLEYPVFVKPANSGSSVGIHKVKSEAALKDAVDNAFLYDTKILVEQGMQGMELEVSVLESLEEGADPFVSVVGEIRPQGEHEFYSYQAKYIDDEGAAIIIPAPISAEIQVKVREVAKEIFHVMECEGMARIDFFLEKASNHIYFNELNTLPGFTEISMYPKLIVASGISYPKLLTHLIDLAIQRHERKSKLCRDYVAMKCTV